MKYDEKVIGKNIKIEREKRKWTQARLGKELNISGKQISNYEKGEPIPPMGILLSLCDIFDCELGYLLGEDDYVEGSKLMTKVTEFTGLSKETIDNIKKVTGTEKRCLSFGYKSEKYKNVLNQFLGAKDFLNLIISLEKLDECYWNKVYIGPALEKELGQERYIEAMDYFNSQTDYFHDPTAEKLDEEIYRAMLMIEKAIEETEAFEYPLKVCHYDVREEFERLIDELYPRYPK